MILLNEVFLYFLLKKIVRQHVFGRLVHVFGLHTDLVFLFDDNDGLADLVHHITDALLVHLVEALPNEHGLVDA